MYQWWDKPPLKWLARFLNHQQYQGVFFLQTLHLRVLLILKGAGNGCIFILKWETVGVRRGGNPWLQAELDPRRMPWRGRLSSRDPPSLKIESCFLPRNLMNFRWKACIFFEVKSRVTHLPQQKFEDFVRSIFGWNDSSCEISYNYEKNVFFFPRKKSNGFLISFPAAWFKNPFHP